MTTRYHYERTPVLKPNRRSERHGVDSIVRDGPWIRVRSREATPQEQRNDDRRTIQRTPYPHTIADGMVEYQAAVSGRTVRAPIKRYTREVIDMGRHTDGSYQFRIRCSVCRFVSWVGCKRWSNTAVAAPACPRCLRKERRAAINIEGAKAVIAASRARSAAMWDRR